MFEFLKNHAFSIGVDMGNEELRLVQLESNGSGINLLAADSKSVPCDIQAGNSEWQRWAIDALRELTAGGGFHGREVTAALPTNEVFIEHMRMPGGDNPDKVILSKIKQKLPFEADSAMVRHIPSEDGNVVVMATEREKINRHLAVYENAQLTVKSMGVWPTALINSYTRFFGRRESDIESVVMLLDIWPSYTNVVICRHKNLLFAHSIPIGMLLLKANDAKQAGLMLELTGCRRHFSLMYKRASIERLILLSAGQHAMTDVDKGIYTMIAERMEMPTQIADCVSAVKMPENGELKIDRRGCADNWAAAFGLSLS